MSVLNFTAAVLATAALFLGSPLMGEALADEPSAPSGATVRSTVYDGQPAFTEEEFLLFVRVLPEYRVWMKSSGQTPEPFLNNGRPDLLFTPDAGAWARAGGWEPVRFHCVLGRAMAALNRLAEPKTDPKEALSPDMPAVSDGELAIVRNHLGEFLKALSEAR